MRFRSPLLFEIICVAALVSLTGNIWSQEVGAELPLRPVESIHLNLGISAKRWSVNADQSLIVVAGPPLLPDRERAMEDKSRGWQLAVVDLESGEVITRRDYSRDIVSLLLVDNHLIVLPKIHENLFNNQVDPVPRSQAVEIQVIDVADERQELSTRLPFRFWDSTLRKADRPRSFIVDTGNSGAGMRCYRADDLELVWQHNPNGTLGLRLFTDPNFLMFDLYPEPFEQSRILQYQIGALVQHNMFQQDDIRHLYPKRGDTRWGRHRASLPSPTRSLNPEDTDYGEKYPVIVRLLHRDVRDSDKDTFVIEYCDRVTGQPIARQELVDTYDIHVNLTMFVARRIHVHQDSVFCFVDGRLMVTRFPDGLIHQLRRPLQLLSPGSLMIDLNEVTRLPIQITGEQDGAELTLQSRVEGIRINENREIEVDGPRIWQEYLERFDGMNDSVKKTIWERRGNPDAKWFVKDMTETLAAISGEDLPEGKVPFALPVLVTARSPNGMEDRMIVTFIALGDKADVQELIDAINAKWSR